VLIVVKIGGARGVSQHLAALSRDISSVASTDKAMVILHGGSAEVDALGERLGVAMRHITSPSGYTSRYTDPATMEVFVMAMAGQINTELVRQFQTHGINAVGLTGLDGGFLRGERKAAIRSLEGSKVKIIRDDLSGSIKSVNVSLVNTLALAGYVPVICPLMLADSGEACNVDADRAAASVAMALKAELLVFLTNVPGVLRDIEDPSSLVRHVDPYEAEGHEKLTSGGMRKKLVAAAEAVRGGVLRAVISDARCEEPLTRAIRGEGTVVSR